jgi:hypothetical protein
MQNKIDATLEAADRDRILDLINQIFNLLPFRVDLTPEERHTLFKMGDWGRPIVEQTLVLAEQDDSFLPRTFDVAEMRKDKELYDNLMPVFIQLSRLFESVQDTMMLNGSDLIMAGLDVYRSAKDYGVGEHLDNLIPLVARRFKRASKKDDGSGSPPQA